jgi:hypothetical protein
VVWPQWTAMCLSLVSVSSAAVTHTALMCILHIPDFVKVKIGNSVQSSGRNVSFHNLEKLDLSFFKISTSTMSPTESYVRSQLLKPYDINILHALISPFVIGRLHSFISSFHSRVQNATNSYRSQELLPFLSVIYFIS